MFGIVLATVNELAAAPPRAVSSRTCLRNPVTRLTSVAIAIEPVEAISREFDVSGPDAVSPSVPTGAAGWGAVVGATAAVGGVFGGAGSNLRGIARVGSPGPGAACWGGRGRGG
ncbi:hypothetical protein GCM10023094_39300 [Rhodococcus olei]|uniref:Uncharacterized protein n=1 Tax=Rhodococcus olei TaxID=2161675 RepID=A0ABP8PC39_9NOCA